MVLTLISSLFHRQSLSTVHIGLEEDSLSTIKPQPGESWLVMGDHAAKYAKAVWDRAHGQLSNLTVLFSNIAEFGKLNEQLNQSPFPAADRVQFLCASLKSGLSCFDARQFDGLLLCDAASEKCETDEVFIREMKRVLRMEGRWHRVGG